MRRAGDAQVIEPGNDSLGDFDQRRFVPKADGDARGIGRQAEHKELVLAPAAVKAAAVHRVEQRTYLGSVRVRVVAAHDLCQPVFYRVGPLCPKHRGGIAHLHALRRALGQQRVQRRGVGKGGGAADGGIGALGFAVGVEGVEVERDDVGARALRAPHALDGGVQALGRCRLASDQAGGWRCGDGGFVTQRILICNRACRYLGTLADQVDVAMQPESQVRIAGGDVGHRRETAGRDQRVAAKKRKHRDDAGV